jgi:hypothetical protein
MSPPPRLPELGPPRVALGRRRRGWRRDGGGSCGRRRRRDGGGSCGRGGEPRAPAAREGGSGREAVVGGCGREKQKIVFSVISANLQLLYSSSLSCKRGAPKFQVYLNLNSRVLELGCVAKKLFGVGRVQLQNYTKHTLSSFHRITRKLFLSKIREKLFDKAPVGSELCETQTNIIKPRPSVFRTPLINECSDAPCTLRLHWNSVWLT